MKRVVVFGKNSNLGSALAESLIHDDIKLESYGSLDCDFLDRKQCLAFFRGLGQEPRTVLFLVVNNKLSRNDYQSFLENITMVDNFVEAQSRANVSHIIYFSSADVYGRAPRLPISEGTRVNPDQWYGKSKYYSECILRRSSLVKCPVTILRLPGVYGNRHRDKSVIGRFVRGIKENGATLIYGSGSVLRDYLHIDDVAIAVRLLIERPYDGVLNLATGSSKSILEIVEILKKSLPYGFKVVHKPADKEREFDLKFDTSKIRTLFPGIKFRGLEDGVSSYLKNRRGKGDD